MRVEFEKAIIKAINDIAEGYYEKTHYDEEGHKFDMSWEDSVNHAIDDFMSDVERYMACEGFDVLTDEDEQEIKDFAWDVNCDTIKNYLMGEMK